MAVDDSTLGSQLLDQQAATIADWYDMELIELKLTTWITPIKGRCASRVVLLLFSHGYRSYA